MRLEWWAGIWFWTWFEIRLKGGAIARDRDVAQTRTEWSEREEEVPSTSMHNVGIDVVAKRRSNGD